MNKLFPMKSTSHTFECGEVEVILESGLIAQNTESSVTVQVGDTVLLATVALGKPLSDPQTFFPLAVHYQERAYAIGKIPGNFFRRETRPSESETLIARLIDRSLRPICPKSYTHEVQLVVTMLSADPQIPPDVPAMLAASAAMSLSSIPFEGPVSGCCIAVVENQFVLNPSMEQRNASPLSLISAANQKGILMFEGGMHEQSEQRLIEATEASLALHQSVISEMQCFIDACRAAGLGRTKVVLQIEEEKQEALNKAYEFLEGQLVLNPDYEVYLFDQEAQKSWLEKQVKIWEGFWDLAVLSVAWKKIARRRMREKILSGQPRPDGRSPHTIRALDVRTGVLPRVYGSALFTRGGTQALGVVTLGSDKDARMLDDVVGAKTEHFLLHYNFLPFCVGSTGQLGFPKRREIGHGALAKRAFIPLLPTYGEFPHTIRVVSEILEADGSSSMATVCATSLALMNAGVPLPRHVAGVAMGLLVEGEKSVVLSDISECEDHLGDLDLKIVGTELGVTALQMDVKVPGVPLVHLGHALTQAKAARIHILKAMNQVIREPSKDPSKWAPQIHQMQIPTHKIRELIGKGGCVVKKISEQFGVKVDVFDSGSVRLTLAPEQDFEPLKMHILQLISDVEVGARFEGPVARIEPFGVFVKLGSSNKLGLLHISELQRLGVKLQPKLGEVLKVKVLALDPKTGKLKLSLQTEVETSLSVEPLLEQDPA